MLEKIEAGSILEGKIVKVKPFGVIVSLPNNLHGLVHISHISSDFVQDINNYFSVGDTVKVKVLSVDIEKSKISLSIKEAISTSKKDNFQKSDTSHNKNDKSTSFQPHNFEDKLKDFLKLSNERMASINKRSKRR